MKKKLLVMAALAVLLLGMLGGAGYAEPTPPPHDTLDTKINVDFHEMLLFFEIKGKSMDINFGTQDIPTGDMELVESKTDQTADAHILYVADRRLSAGNWNMVAEISEFTATGEQNFAGTLRLYSPTLVKANETTLEPNIAEGEAFISVGVTSGLVARATKDAQLRDFQLQFSPVNTRLMIKTLESAKVKATAYTATVTWTLSTTPGP